MQDSGFICLLKKNYIFGRMSGKDEGHECYRSSYKIFDSNMFRIKNRL